jgi:cohesin complex subunit SA-1/2
MATVSTFLRAIRAGAVHFRHGDVSLANYEGLGPSFDLPTKVIIDVLRKEGMYNDNGDMVIEVRCGSLPRTLAPPDDACLQSVSLVMDVVVENEERMAGLEK